MSNNIIQEKINTFNNSKISQNYNKSKTKINPIQIEENNSSKGIILRNAGQDVFDYKRYFTSEDASQANNFSQSVINLKHKGIKRKNHPLYDPYLIQVCKNAIIREKNELPNYKDIIEKVNTEYGIENEKTNENKFYNDNKLYNNFLQNNHIASNNISLFNNSSSNLKDINNSAMSTNIIEKR